MAFYGSIFGNETLWNRRPVGHARHNACPRRLKYIHDIKDGYIPYVEDSDSVNRTSYRTVSQKTNRLGLYNTADVWREELMGLAQQVQSSLQPLDESRFIQRRSRQTNSSISTSYSQENNEQNISKRLLNRRASTGSQHSYTPKPRMSIDENEQQLSTDNKNQDPGIWLLPILCYILQVDNILDAQEWLVNANPTEKRFAMELISRKMQDMQSYESEMVSDMSTSHQSSTVSNLNNLYWPYKFWQYQQQSKLPNDTCERATSPVRILTPAKRLSISSISTRSNQSSETRLSTPITSHSHYRPSRSTYRVTTSAHSSNQKSLSANFRGKTPLI